MLDEGYGLVYDKEFVRHTIVLNTSSLRCCYILHSKKQILIMSSTIREKSIDSEENTCPVCFKDVEVFSIGVCDHPICHECSTRMRILCKEDACPICRQELVKVTLKSILLFYTNLNIIF